jgi:hypothetical protein
MYFNLTRSLPLLFLSASLLPVASAQSSIAQSCPSGNGTLNSSYDYIISQAASTSSSGSSTSGFSTSEIGNLLNGTAGSVPFAASGQLTFNGSGQITAPQQPGGLNQIVGTYNINSDCMITVMLMDPFGTNTRTLSLVGFVLADGAEIDLGPSPSTTSSSTASSIQVVSSFAMRLIRPLYSSGCSLSTLNGPYALVSQVTFQSVPISPPGTGNIIGLARVRFDGNGNMVADQPAVQSQLVAFQYVGTYTVNSDCSGTMMLNGPGATPTSTATALGQSMTANFVITPAMVYFGLPTAGSNALRPGLVYVISNSGQTAMGYGSPL